MYELAPAVDPNTVIAAGATGFRALVPAYRIPGVLEAYAQAVDRVFYLTTGAAICSFFFAWGMGWATVKKKSEKREEQ